jgi:AcrR family transcriptional regulator
LLLMALVPSSTAQALLDVAERLFSARGYAATGIREIADQAGVNVASIKYHFGSKRELYLATVREAMSRPEVEAMRDLLAARPKAPLDGAIVVARFIRAWFAKVVTRPEMTSCGLLMMREALSPSEAVDAVVDDYLKPRRADVVEVISAIVPEATTDELARYADFFYGQLLHYQIFRPFIERLGNVDLSDSEATARIAEQMTRFMLRGLRCDDALIDDALDRSSRDAPIATGEMRS